MPALAARFADAVDAALGIAEAGEIVRAGAPFGSVVFRELRPSRLEAIHEMAFLRIFVEWENFLEMSFLRMQCGFVSSLYTPLFATGRARQRTLADAQAALYGSQQWLLWHNPDQTVTRAQRWFIGAPHELVTLSDLDRLESFAAVRHGIAHRSQDALRKLDAATNALAGRRYRGSSAGRFLRDWDTSITPPARWLQSIATEFVGLASQMCP